MKIRVMRTAFRGSPVRYRNNPWGANLPPVPRTIPALVERFGPRCAGTAIVTLIALLFLAVWWAPGTPETSLAAAGKVYSGWGWPPGKTFQWYLSEGQWKADARTALAVVQFVLSRDPDPSTPPVVPQAAPFLSATTNSGTNMPNV